MAFKVAIFGVPGFNRGDDAISESLILGLRTALGSVDISIAQTVPPAQAPTSSARAYFVKRGSLRGFMNMFLLIWSCDLVVLGGGSLIQDQFGGGRLKGVLGYAWFVTLISNLLGKDVVTAPLGVDELLTRSGRKVAVEILRRCKRLTVRDQASRLRALQLLPGGEVHVAPDPVFGLNDNEVLPKLNQIALAPAFEGGHKREVVGLFADIIEKLGRSNSELKFKIVAMDIREEEDGGWITAILDRLDEDLKAGVELIWPVDPWHAADIFRRSLLTVTMRLHAAILSYGSTNVICISRNSKTDVLLDEYQIPGIPVADCVHREHLFKVLQSALDDKVLVPLHRERLVKLRAELESYYRYFERYNEEET